MRLKLISLFILLPACAQTPKTPSPLSTGPQSIETLLRDHPIGAQEAVKAIEVHRTGEASFHLVQVATQEKPHRHDEHDLTGLVLRGKGVLYIGNTARPLAEGDSFFVPRKTPHYFVNQSTGVAAAWVTFTPAFNKIDSIPINDLPAK